MKTFFFGVVWGVLVVVCGLVVVVGVLGVGLGVVGVWVGRLGVFCMFLVGQDAQKGPNMEQKKRAKK